LYHIQSNRHDIEFFDDRISLFPDEDNLIIYDNLNLYDDRIKNTPYSSKFYYSYKEYTKNMLLITDPALASYCLILYKQDMLLISDSMGNIKSYDDQYKTQFEYELMEYFSFIIFYQKNDTRDELMEEVNYNNNNNNNDSQFIGKPSIKPYNRDGINLFQDGCNTDYGDRRISRKELKNRKDYITNVISIANERYINAVEEEIVTGNYRQRHSKVVFCIPNSIETVINHVKK
jgi:hypothetical protein